MKETQISAYISEETKQLVERYVKAHGVKKGHLIEQALLHHLQALSEIPADVVIPPRVVLDAESSKRVAEAILSPPPPTAAMKALMAGKPIKSRRVRKTKAA
jgi:uncharacterized protein (DUF1778 family)